VSCQAPLFYIGLLRLLGVGGSSTYCRRNTTAAVYNSRAELCVGSREFASLCHGPEIAPRSCGIDECVSLPARRSTFIQWIFFGHHGL